MREHTERWIKLRAKAAVEEDAEKLVQLVSEIIELLEAKRAGYAFSRRKPISGNRDIKLSEAQIRIMHPSGTTSIP